MHYILALDQGTTSSRAILFDESGAAVASSQLEFAQIYPEPGQVEHRPEDIWQSQREAAEACLESAQVSARDVAAIGIANQRETTLLWDAHTGEPAHNAIVWQDRRTAPICEELRSAGLAPLVAERTGLVLDPYFSGTKIMWLLRNQPGLRERAERGDVLFGTVDTYLLWRLTGGRVHATDPSNASRTLLYNLRTGDWDSELLDALSIPRAILPEVLPTAGSFGETNAEFLGHSVPVTGMAGDQQAALFGQMCLDPGQAKNTYGTGCFVLLNIGSQLKIPKGGLLATVAWDLGGGPIYAIEGSVFVAGAAIQWLRDELGIIKSASEVEELAARAPNAGGVYFVPAFVGLGAPYWDPYARGLLIGLTRGTGRHHLARAALEGICFQSRDVLQAMAAEAGLDLQVLRADGGASQNNLLLQLQADILGVPVERPANTETTALGAAYLAGHAAGVWPRLEDLRAKRRVDQVFEPEWDEDRRESSYRDWSRAVKLARGWASPQ
ncbi:MAG: glycerol kinase GlpK [Anaerolineae bacterium]|nr:glycerol kinase GlpK [Anaerolineae bacterium]